jgi:hypothetical protein
VVKSIRVNVTEPPDTEYQYVVWSLVIDATDCGVDGLITTSEEQVTSIVPVKVAVIPLAVVATN